MKVVIDIPNWLYNAIIECKEPIYSQSLGDAVRDGTPLPKGHGRLKDIDKVERLLDLEKPDNVIAKALKTIIECVPTIIEADKETENDYNNLSK